MKSNEIKQKKKAKATKLQEAIINLLLKIPLFDGLYSNDLHIVAQYMNFFEVKEGEVVFHEGDNGDYVCFVVKGKIDILKESVTGRSALIASLRAGRTLGEMAIIDKTPRSATAKAATDTILLTLSQKGFDTILEQHPKIGIEILKGLARLLSMNMRKTSSRLADYMLTMT